jgi:hypothetical protein
MRLIEKWYKIIERRTEDLTMRNNLPSSINNLALRKLHNIYEFERAEKLFR